jgi:hypothetical protein
VFYVHPFGNWSNTRLYSVALSVGRCTTYTLSTSTTGTGAGTITGCGGSYASGASFSCTLAPSGGSTLVSVSGCGGSGTSTYAGTMPASNCTVTATFNTSGGASCTSSTCTAASANESDLLALPIRAENAGRGWLRAILGPVSDLLASCRNC